jgi:hypothetical protein
MRLASLLAAVASCFACTFARSDDPAPSSKWIARNGNALIVSIELNFTKTAGDSKKAEFQLRLFFSAKSAKPREYLLRLTELKPIEDDTGKLLSPPELFEKLPELHEETRIAQSRDDAEIDLTGPREPEVHEGDLVGRYLELKLEAPARTAATIKSIQGKAILARPKLVAVGIPNVTSFDDTRLDDPKLKDFELRATVRARDDQTDIFLQAPRWNSRLVAWGLAREGRMLREGARSESGGSFRKVYAENAAKKDTLLALVLREAIEPEVIEFEFKDVPLP